MRPSPFLLIVCLASVGICNAQTEVATKHYSGSYSDNNICFSYTFDLSLPYCTHVEENDIRKMMNDSVASIARSLQLFEFGDGAESPTFNFFDDDYPCDDFSMSPDQTELKYAVHMNTAEILSIYMEVAFTAGGGGNGFGIDFYCFNLDLKKNKMLQLEDLFGSKNKEKVIALFLEQYRLYMPDAGDELDEKVPEGFTIDQNEMTCYYTYLSYGKGVVHEISLPIEKLKPFFLKNFIGVK